MYASELAIGHLVGDKARIDGELLDCHSDDHKSPLSRCYHVHCFHNPKSQVFSKFFWKDGGYNAPEYSEFYLSDKDFKEIRWYALATALGYEDLVYEKVKEFF